MSSFWKTLLLYLAIVVSILIVTAVCWHSLEEIHYLKSFYPKQFTVEGSFYASGVELIKVFVIGVPFFLVIWVSLCLLKIIRDRDE
ncbi:MAG: hypothetical protein GWN86_01355 [Desulfobacterales bacterium]|nr:hypothetical protein [Desulfobacterales bacterium]